MGTVALIGLRLTARRVVKAASAFLRKPIETSRLQRPATVLHQQFPSIQRRDVGGAFALHILQPQSGRCLRLIVFGWALLVSARLSALRSVLDNVLICGNAGKTALMPPQPGQGAPSRLS